MSTTQSINDDIRRDVAANQTTGRRGILLRLLGKEARQLFPLLAVLIACGVFLHLLGLLQQPGNRAAFHSTILMLLPVLFAVGVGPMLISQEKEQRTLRWMASLPIPSRSIVTSKLIVSLLGLIVVWGVSLGDHARVLSTYAVIGQLLRDRFAVLAGQHVFLAGDGSCFSLDPANRRIDFSCVVIRRQRCRPIGDCCEGVFSYLYNHRYSPNAFLYFLSFFQLVITAILAGAAIRLGKGPLSRKPEADALHLGPAKKHLRN